MLGLISVIAGGLGFVLACSSLMQGWGAMIPAGMLLLTGFVLAIVSLFRKGQGKGLGIAGLIVSIVGSIVGFVALVTAITFAVGNVFVDETGELFDSIEEQAQEEAQEPPASSETGPVELLPLGSTVTSEDWEVTVNSVSLAQTDVVLAENAFNGEPEPGYEYILVNVTTTYVGDAPDGEMPGFVSFDYVAASGEVTPPPLLLIPDELDRVTVLQQGGSATGNIVLVAPTETASDGAIAVTPGLMADPEFVATQ
ncbi:DUF4352 domain-containing protein [Microbacterium sp. zg-YB36]|uniref:DUF4352 domain-containing protein n=1 Tax=Microbacterium sp. zg-YB36 TaxID=2969407 RepID=UPI00214CE4CD|nr:DUF4352 domain-containing protein [Microbacterium sp. zg-YB36]MDL5350517.1 DUF4352 domain-containing protein [Microbacterium sp. zg-YB36]